MNNRIISLEGNISSGKSTLLIYLKEKYKENKDIIFVDEPLDKWEKFKDKSGMSILEKFYNNQEKYSFAFQMMAYISRLSILNKTCKENPNAIIITERSLYTDKYVFAKMLFDEGKMEDIEYAIYLEWFQEFSNTFQYPETIYIQTDPEVCYKRIHQRGRLGEEQISLDYLTNCNKYHKEFLSTPTILLDGNNDIFDEPIVIIHWLEIINKLIYNI